MINAQLLEYIRQQLAQGLDKATIEHNLTNSGGWLKSDIDAAFGVINSSQPVPTAPIPGTTSIPTQAPGVKYAGFWVRFVAAVVDSLIISIPFFILSILAAGDGVAKPTTMFVVNAVCVIISLLYYCLLTYFKGATLGKMLVGIEVRNVNLEKLSFGRVLLREIVGKFVSSIILSIGYIVAAFTSKKQGVHDFIAGSVVVYKRQEGGSKVGLIVGIVIAVIIPVLAIIGILSSVVLVSLSSARDKGRDAAVKSALMSARAGMEVYFAENNNTYSVARDCASGVFANNTVKSALSNIPFQKLICYAEKDTYAISAELSTRGDSFCVDTTGYSGEGTATDTNGKASCQGEGVSVAAAQISNNQVQTQTQTTSTWNAKVVGGQLSEKDKAEIIAGTMKMVAVVTSGDVATFRKYAAVFAPPEQIQQLEKASDEQLLQLMKMIGPIMAAEVTPEILTSSAAVWTVKDATHVEIKVQKDKNSSQTTRAVKVDGVWY